MKEKDLWTPITPNVSKEAEFLEIVTDFGNPLELIREAISNSIDAKATKIRISITVESIEGSKKLVIVITDNGTGMTKDILSHDFWGLGFSKSRGVKEAIGEKGHGTKIYLRSEKVEVKTQHERIAYLSFCEKPMGDLSQNKIHHPFIKEIPAFQESDGTELRIIGYNENQKSIFVQNNVKDYILWFTKIGSVEREFGINRFTDLQVMLKCIDQNEYEEITFGHRFPDEDSDIERLFNEFQTNAPKYFVKKYCWKELRLDDNPEVTFDVVIYVEGDEVKKKYNPMIRGVNNEKGSYRVRDRYGLWICKDYIPITRVNEWISGFGSGSNSFVLLHGFINCQDLKLTANRGTFSNTDPQVIEELEKKVSKLIELIDDDLNKKNLYTLIEWQEEEKTKNQEKIEFDRRCKQSKKRKFAELTPDKLLTPRLLLEPQNESELFALFLTILTLKPDSFNFQIADYNTSTGIDILAQNINENKIVEGEFKYIELKYLLRQTKFNHVFDYIRWLICWDFDKNVTIGTEFVGIDDKDHRILEQSTGEDGHNLYFLRNNKKPWSIQVIKLKEFLYDNFNLLFKPKNE